MSNIKRKFFIGSSRKYMLFADALKELFIGHPFIEAITWSDYFNVRGGNKFAYEALLKAVSEIEFAVFFISRDWKLDGSKPSFAATPNVWFEAGMFMSRYGKENVLIIEEELDAYDNEIQYLSDLTGLQPEYFRLTSTTKDYINYSVMPTWKAIEVSTRTEILTALCKVKKKIEFNITDDKERVFDTVLSIKNRKACYQQGERMIREANEFVYSIVSYENEYEDKDYPNGLFPYIENKMNEKKLDPSFTSKKSANFFKRYMNLANDEIAKQAELILNKYSEYIEIKDTYCNFLEVLITEKEVLIVLPKPNNIKAVIGKGVLIKSEEVAREFLTWFEFLIPEPNKIKIDTLEKLKIYRDLTWTLQNKRKEGDNYRCNACFVSFEDQPKEIQRWLEETGLKK